jgi:hypothetical protein
MFKASASIDATAAHACPKSKQIAAQKLGDHARVV